MTYDRLPRWLGPENAGLFSCLHLPKNKNISSVGVVLCNALGHEYIHSHRSIRHLADQLADNGIPALRFDYYATGDSAGDLSTPIELSTWLENIETAVQALKETSGVSSIALIGVRMGATLAALYAEERPCDYLILWNPCVSGQRYIREMQALSIMASHHLSENLNAKTKNTESAGFVMHTNTAAEIQALNLKKLNYQKIRQNCKKILLLERDDVIINNKYFEILKKNALQVDLIRSPGYPDMVAEPHDTIIPKNAIAQITNWLNAIASQTRPDTLIELKNSTHTQTTLYWEGKQINETICHLGNNNLLGILSQANNHDASPQSPLIILSNAGSTHHVGPNRLYVELSRSLAANGFSCLRFDLANLGDSINQSATDENHPYPKSAIDDTAAAIHTMQSQYGFQRFILAGLCSGSHTSFHAGLNLRNTNICECILINPLTFYWEDGMSLDIPNTYKTIKNAQYYQHAIKDFNKWVKLFTGQAQTKYITGFFFKFIATKLSSITNKILELIALKRKSNLEKDLIRYKEIDRHLSFFFSTTDPGYNILLSETKKTTLAHQRDGRISIEFIQEADHTFSKLIHRRDLINKLIKHLENRY